MDAPHKYGIVLFAHGARSAAWAEPFKKLQNILATQEENTVVVNAYLEFMTPDLASAIQQIVDVQGCNHITVIPVFLAQGGHVLNDLAALMASLRQSYPLVKFYQGGALGEDEIVLNAISEYCLRVAKKHR